MTKKQALRIKLAVKALFNLLEDDRYQVAVRQYSDNQFEVHIFVKNPLKSGLLECAMIARVIADLVPGVTAMESSYYVSDDDETDFRKSIKIW